MSSNYRGRRPTNLRHVPEEQMDATFAESIDLLKSSGVKILDIANETGHGPSTVYHMLHGRGLHPDNALTAAMVLLRRMNEQLRERQSEGVETVTEYEYIQNPVNAQLRTLLAQAMDFIVGNTPMSEIYKWPVERRDWFIRAFALLNSEEVTA